MDGQYSPTLKPTDSIYMTYSFILSLVHMDRHTITWWFFFSSFSSGDEVQLAGHGCNKIDPVTKEKRMANFVWLLHSFTLLFGFDFLFGNCDDMYRFFNYVLNVMHDRFPQFHVSQLLLKNTFCLNTSWNKAKKSFFKHFMSISWNAINYFSPCPSFLSLRRPRLLPRSALLWTYACWSL